MKYTKECVTPLAMDLHVWSFLLDHVLINCPWHVCPNWNSLETLRCFTFDEANCTSSLKFKASFHSSMLFFEIHKHQQRSVCTVFDYDKNALTLCILSCKTVFCLFLPSSSSYYSYRLQREPWKMRARCGDVIVCLILELCSTKAAVREQSL